MYPYLIERKVSSVKSGEDSYRSGKEKLNIVFLHLACFTHTPFQNNPHIPEETAQNNKRTPDKKLCVPDDAADRSLPWQGG